MAPNQELVGKKSIKLIINIFFIEKNEMLLGILIY